jgi:hypothetical protein
MSELELTRVDEARRDGQGAGQRDCPHPRTSSSTVTHAQLA